MRNKDFGKKPDNTRIQLTKSGDCFDVYVPPLFQPVMLFVVPFVILWFGFPWFGFIHPWTLMAAKTPFPENISLMIPLLLVGAIGCFLAYICLFSLFCKAYFRIDRHEISLIKTIFGVKISRKQSEPKREITKLIFTHSRLNNGRRIAAALKIEIGTKLIVLGGSGGGILHEAEIAWLASEVSEWLDKTLKIY